MRMLKRMVCALATGAMIAMAVGVPVSAAGWRKNGNSWQYQYGQNGDYYRDCWQSIDGCWYRFDGQGRMKTGWFSDSGCWYYCGADGAMKTGWICDGNCWYYCDGSGAMKTGWVYDGGKWYYCRSDGVMQTGWVEVGGKQYFCNSSGVMQTGLIQIDGVTCQFDQSGALVQKDVPGYASAAYTASGQATTVVDPVKDGTTVKVTIPEGKDASEIATILEQNGVCRREAFLKAINAYQTTSKTFDGICGNSALFYQFEGCLYPDTYEFYRYENPETVIRKMLINFDEKISSLTAEMDKKGLTLLETLTLASVIQQEAGQPEDMAKVSAVFWNRLENSAEYPKLQSNPTKEYMESVILPERQLGNAAVNPASYDTYQQNGLPAGPICNPGMDAILAALNPDPDCDAYFFCTDKQGTFYFAKTYAEHQKNVEIASQVQK